MDRINKYNKIKSILANNSTHKNNQDKWITKKEFQSKQLNKNLKIMKKITSHIRKNMVTQFLLLYGTQIDGSKINIHFEKYDGTFEIVYWDKIRENYIYEQEDNIIEVDEFKNAS